MGDVSRGDEPTYGSQVARTRVSGEKTRNCVRANGRRCIVWPSTARTMCVAKPSQNANNCPSVEKVMQRGECAARPFGTLDGMAVERHAICHRRRRRHGVGAPS